MKDIGHEFYVSYISLFLRIPSTPCERITKSCGTIFASRNERFSEELGPTNLIMSFSTLVKTRLPNESCKTFKQIMIEARVRRIFTDFAQNANEMLGRNWKEGRQSISAYNHNPHQTLN